MLLFLDRSCCASAHRRSGFPVHELCHLQPWRVAVSMVICVQKVGTATATGCRDLMKFMTKRLIFLFITMQVTMLFHLQNSRQGQRLLKIHVLCYFNDAVVVEDCSVK